MQSCKSRRFHNETSRVLFTGRNQQKAAVRISPRDINNEVAKTNQAKPARIKNAAPSRPST
jgi:hypothetical protein